MTIILFLNLIFTILIVKLEYKRPEEVFRWLIVLWLLPVVGVFAYIFLWGRKRNRLIYIKRNRKFNEKYNELVDNWVLTGDIKRSNEKLIATKNEVKIFKNGNEKYKELFKDINYARRSIHIEYYAIHDDIVGRKLINLLEKKAKQGVEVRVIYDGFANISNSDNLFRNLKALGGKVKRYKLYGIGLNFRTHRKIVVIDGRIGYTGGINIGNKYANMDKIKNPWRDSHVKLRGGSVNLLQYYFIKEWIYLNDIGKLDIDLSMLNKYFRGNDIERYMNIQIITSGTDEDENSMDNAYINLIRKAEWKVIIQTPYVIPDNLILKELIVAINNGIEVILIVPGISSGPIINDVSDYYINKLIECGAKIYKYNGYMHAKTLVIDEGITMIGSVNLDFRSLLVNNEIGAIFYDKDLTKEYLNIIAEDFKNSRELNYIGFKKRKGIKRIKENILRLFGPLL